MNIGIDLDSVIANVIDPALEILNRKYQKEIKKEDVNSWYSFKELYGISTSEFLRVLEQVWRRHENLKFEEEDLPIYLKRLERKEHSISIITNRTKASYSWVCSWLHENSVPFDNLIFADYPKFSKLDFPIDCLVDDAPRIVEDAQKFPEKTIYLRTQPWNKDLEFSENNIIRIENIEELVEKL